MSKALKIKVHPSPSARRRRVDVKRFQAAAEYFARTLGIEEGDIKVDITRKVGRTTRGYARCSFGKSVYIAIKLTSDVERMLETLAHEMVHAKQYIKGELKHTIGTSMRWETEWRGRNLGAKILIPYRERPWEIEAFDRQYSLYNSFRSYEAREAQPIVTLPPVVQGTKSDAIRELARQGMSVADIARKLGAHYSFVHGVVKKMKAVA